MSIKKQRNPDKFNFFIPATFEKGRKGKNEVVRVKGIASTSSATDTDGEVLFPEGFDYSPLLERGFLNWDHQQKSRPAAIVGEPDVAKIVNGGKDFYIEGFLYPNSTEAQQVAELAEVLEKNSSTRRLGYSIEGQVIERASNDKNNPLYKQIVKARITGVAITPCPKNPNTILSLVKGEYNDLYVEDEEEATTCPYCDHDQVYNGKCLECGKEMKKAFTAEGSVDLRPESVEGVKYDKKKNDFTITDDVPKVGHSVRKSEIYDLIAENYTTDVVKANRIYSFINTVNSKMFNMQNEISQEAIEKAFEYLNLAAGEPVKAQDATVIEKGEKDKYDDDDNDEVKKGEFSFEKACEVCKGLLTQGMTKGQAIDEMQKGGFSLEISSNAAERVAAEMSGLPANGGEISNVAAPNVGETQALSKALDDLLGKVDGISENTNTLIKGLADDINGTLDRKFSSVGTILKKTLEQNTLLKGTVDELQKSNTELAERLSKIEELPLGRKSATTVQQIERFNKSESGTAKTGANVYSLSKKEDRNDLGDRIQAEIEKSRGEGRTASKLLEDAVFELEMMGSLSKAVQPILKSMNIEVTA